MKSNLNRDLGHLHTVLNNLDELGDIMGEMISTQEVVEVSQTFTRGFIQLQLSEQKEAMEELNPLHSHLTTLEQLHEQYVAYRMAFNKLLLEISRRRQYREAAENIARGMMRQLESMTEGDYSAPYIIIQLMTAFIEEDRVRAHFNAEYGQYLPEDLCLSIANAPTTWEIIPAGGTTFEVLPHIDNDIIAEVSNCL